MKTNIKQLNVKIVSDKVTTFEQPDIDDGSFTITSHFTVVEDIFFDGRREMWKLHAHSDLKRIEYLEKELENLKSKHYALLEMNRNFVKYDMPGSKEILESRLYRQFNLSMIEPMTET